MTFKISRLILSLLFLISFVLIFLLFFIFSADRIEYIINILIGTQFVPSVLKAVSSGISISFGFIIILGVTILFGRIYCSTICPLGTMQDTMIFVRKKFFKKTLTFKSSKGFIRLSILSLTIILYLFGFISLLNFIDPYSIFMRSLVNIFEPMTVKAINFIIETLMHFKVYMSFHFSLHKIELSVFLITIGTFLSINILAFFKGRTFCNTICPVGTILGYISRLSLFNFRLDKKKCISCYKCVIACKSYCIDIRKKNIDLSRCVSCFNCVSVCPNNSAAYKIFGNKKKIDSSKRTFLKETALFSIFAVNLPFSKKNKSPINSEIISPPGSISVSNFTENCTSCHLCVSACPTKVLRPVFYKKGMSGIMQPVMDFKTSFCDFECNRCSRVCPTGSIKKIKLEEKKLTQIGKVNLIKKKCLVYKDNKECGACAEHCPTKAVYMIPYKNIYGPITNQNVCIGCGSCENICPTVPDKAIVVESNKVHIKVDKNAKQQDEKLIEKRLKAVKPEDFPF